MELRDYSKVGDAVPVPDLVAIQTQSYSRFLQVDVPADRRKNRGLEALLREVFPIKSYDGSMSLEYIRYELGRPRYEPEECRKLRLTYGRPFKVVLRLDRPGEPIEEDVYLGDLPVMMGGGEFLINGAERVIVTQLHRSPGVDFNQEVHPTGKRLHSFRIIPERGSWIEASVSKKDVLQVRIDQSGKIPISILLRAMDERYSTNEDILRELHETEVVPLAHRRKASESKKALAARLAGRITVRHIIDPDTGEVLVESAYPITEEVARTIVELADKKRKKPGTRVADLAQASLMEVELLKADEDALVVTTLQEDGTSDHEAALLRIYRRLRPGNPPNLDRARDLVWEKFQDANRYRLGRVGRFRINRKFNQDIPESEMALRAADLASSIRYVLALRRGAGELDDIDHLGNRRVRTIDELAADELRKGFLKLVRTVQERMNLKDQETLTPRVLVNSRTISAALESFFGRSELSQVVDQINPLAQLTHERRLSALGPGGLNRKRAGFDVRDVHPSHYGRICPIETPEGTNIGLIVSLSIYATVDAYGFLTTPYRKLRNSRFTGDVDQLRADEEGMRRIAPADIPVARDGRISRPFVLARAGGEFSEVGPKDLDYADVSPKQMVGVSASLIPFLEHNDANRALMGSNMQRQAVPLMRTEQALICTGMERYVAENSGMVVVAQSSGTVTKLTADRIVIDPDGKAGDGALEYTLKKFVGLNARTCLNQRSVVQLGQKVKRGQVIADGAATCQGELALGKNVLVAFLPWEGCNFEDAILISQRLVKDDVYTSIHIDEFESEIRETKLGREEFTRDIPNVSERALRNLDEEGIVRVGTKVKPGDILVGKVAPKSKTELSPEEKLLHAIFGRAGEDVKNDSLTVSAGVEGIVIDTQKFSRKASLSDERREKDRREIRRVERSYNTRIVALFKEMVGQMVKVLKGKLTEADSGRSLTSLDRKTDAEVLELEEQFDLENLACNGRKVRGGARLSGVSEEFNTQIEAIKDEKDRILSRLKRGDELPTGVLEMVKIYIATKRVLATGDKMAGRHGNKGVIARTLPEEDMPFLEDGTPIDIVLNPLGVPSRMNIGQILETHLGWAARLMGYRVVTPAFDGATEEEIRQALGEAGLPQAGKVVLSDGRTGDPFDQRVTVGFMYMMKLDHLVDDKIHARSTGPYSLITQQPLGGKARCGGQRFGEMEVWALEAYGAAYILQELLTVKSDDVEGRTRIYESMVKGENALEAGTPVSFEVLVNEIKGLGLNLKMDRQRKETPF